MLRRVKMVAMRKCSRTSAVAWLMAAALSGCGTSSKAGSADASLEEADAAAYYGCPDTVPDLVVGLKVMGKSGKISASLVDASPSPPRKYLNTWTLQLADANDSPLEDATVTAIRTYMPLHGHEGKPSPDVAMLADKADMQTNLHFIMRGYWEVQINLSSPSVGDDYIVFPTCVTQ
jgi:hypothetical protein